MNKNEINEVLRLHKLYLKGDIEGKKANLKDAYLKDANLKDADLRGVDLGRANLRGSNLRGAFLIGTNLRGADLRGVDLGRADLTRADLGDANLRGAFLIGADLKGSDLSRANLIGADLRDTNLTMTKGVLSFTGGKHFAFAFIFEDVKYIKIGCKCYEVKYWIKFGKSIGEKEEYTSNEIKLYSFFINFINTLPKGAI